MTRGQIVVGSILCLSTFAFSQADQQPAKQGGITSDRPTGTKVVDHDRDTIVQPQRKPVKVDANVVKSAQKALNDRGYDSGTPDGVIGPRTKAAVNKFQADEGIAQSGTFDATTLSKLNVGGTQIVKSAPADLGRGGKAAAHNAVEGHPVAAGKAAGTGAETFGKKVAKGSKSLAVGGVEKVGKGISAIGGKITGKAQGTDDDKNKPADDNNQPQ
jgi:peptidoglycan hydrolase-like protein with peptidoglycan-binding domain